MTEILTKLEIRKMVKDELDEIMQIEEEAYGEHHWSRESFYNELNNNLAFYYTARNENNKIVGFSGSWQIFDEAHITNIAVKTSERRKKIGETLLNSIIKDCYKNKIKYITLEVRVSNKAAINLYEKYGFKSLGVRKGYYQNNNEDALIMWTENIFGDKFKENYERIFNELNKQTEVQWI